MPADGCSHGLAFPRLRRFRQDGVRRDPRTLASDGVIPFTPSGPEFFRHQILLMKLIPGNAYNFPNNSLTMAEQVGVLGPRVVRGRAFGSRVPCPLAMPVLNFGLVERVLNLS